MSQPKYRSSCDACLTAKLKCNQAKPCCARCLSTKRECVYSQYRKIGRPSRKTSVTVENTTGPHRKSTSTEAHTREAQKRFKATCHHVTNATRPLSDAAGIIDGQHTSDEPLDARPELDMFGMGISEWDQSPTFFPQVSNSHMDLFMDDMFHNPAPVHKLSASTFSTDIPEIGNHVAYAHVDALPNIDDSNFQPMITPSSSVSRASTATGPSGRDSNAASPAPSWSTTGAASSIQLFASIRTGSSDKSMASLEMNRNTRPLPAGNGKIAQTNYNTTNPFLFGAPATDAPSFNPQCTNNCLGELSTMLNKLSENDLEDGGWTMDTALVLERKIWKTNDAIFKCSACMVPTRRGQILMLLCLVLSKVLGYFEKANPTLGDDTLSPVSQTLLSRAGQSREQTPLSGRRCSVSKPLHELRLGSIVLESHVRDFLWTKFSKSFVKRLVSLVENLEISLAGLPKADISTKVAREVLQDITDRGACLRGVLVYAEHHLATSPP